MPSAPSLDSRPGTFVAVSASPNMSRKIDSLRSSRCGKDLAALGAKFVGLVEDRGDPALLVERRERNLESPRSSSRFNAASLQCATCRSVNTERSPVELVKNLR